MESTMDFTPLERLPIEPCKIVVNMSFFDYTTSGERQKRNLLCLFVEASFTQAKQPGNKSKTTRN